MLRGRGLEGSWLSFFWSSRGFGALLLNKEPAVIGKSAGEKEGRSSGFFFNYRGVGEASDTRAQQYCTEGVDGFRSSCRVL